MTIDTKVFVRIVNETKSKVRQAAIKSIADTMEETARFGCFARSYIERCAEDRLERNHVQ